MGKTTTWIKTKRRWRKENPPNHEGYYVCYLCGKWIPDRQITLDHVIPRSRAPELRYDFNNLRPCCWSCNSEKGSKVLDQP